MLVMLYTTILKSVRGIKMDVAQIKTLIDTMGFPIFICLVLLWFIKGTLQKHSQLMDEIQKSLAANTESIRLLIQKLQDK